MKIDYVLFINCRSVPFVQKIMNREKIYETRTRDTLRSLVGKRVYLCETGKGISMVRCSAIILNAFPVRSFHEWEMFRSYTCVPADSEYEWKPDTKVKWLYELAGIRSCVPFHPAEGKRHGRVYMDFVGGN